ncbi:hypothetical protein J7T55_014259 [Diaporthe amygdali]|uniref:uncharacterized protein n=1 Tax=Phomopsis amygdali TaxID=1214568 RepID=UPI0022FE4B95|nr:uncharacterized protein J7T55_014259 [Diaporthe amygdali]KAJ0109697.1 hypothetical protein J7T55_014259 [Diaporthe amygdali]
MEGLKLIAQSTFDRHQKFRSGNDDSQRYNVIEIGAFESPNAQLSTSGTASNRQSIGSIPNAPSVSDGGTGDTKSQKDASKATGTGASDAGGNYTTFNEWTVHEEDLVAFMKMRPVESVVVRTKRSVSQLQQADPKKAKEPSQAIESGTASTVGHSRSVSLQSNKTAATSITTATTGTSPGKTSDEAPRKAKQEVEAAASLKIVCIQRAAPEEVDGADTNTLAISREAFLHLYVDTMDADHGALYFIARDYDGFHEYNDTTKGIVTTFIGTADYALVWTFNRRSLETRGLLIDRKPPEKAKDPGPAPEATTAKKKTSKGSTGAVIPSEAWVGFRNMLKMYRGYIFAPPLLSFVSCLHMLHSFDDQLSASDLPHVKDIERKVGNGTTEITKTGDGGKTTRSKSQPLSRQSSNYATKLSTEPSFVDFSPGTPTQKPFSIDKLISWSQASGEIADSAARKLRQIKMGKEILEMISREHETLVADVVAPSFLDRYHRAMQGMIEAIPAVERHMASLEETLVDLKARTERLNGLISALFSREQANTDGNPMASSLDLALTSEDPGTSSVNRMAMMSTTLMPITLFSAVIAIALIRWSVVLPCMIFFFLGWSTVTQREWVNEASGRSYHDDEHSLRPGIISQVPEKVLQG